MKRKLVHTEVMPIRWGDMDAMGHVNDTIYFRYYVGTLGRSSLETYLELRPSYDPGRIYAEGAAKAVWVDYQREKSVPLPESIRQLIGS